MVYVWIGVIVAAIVLEMLTDQLIAVWFMPSAVICIVLAALKVPVAVQIIVFFVLSAVLLILYKTVLKKFIVGKKKERTNTELVIGEIGVVQQPIDNLVSTGLVKVKFQVWSARSADDGVTFQIGEHVKVVSIEGVKLICKKADE